MVNHHQQQGSWQPQAPYANQQPLDPYHHPQQASPTSYPQQQGGPYQQQPQSQQPPVSPHSRNGAQSWATAPHHPASSSQYYQGYEYSHGQPQPQPQPQPPSRSAHQSQHHHHPHQHPQQQQPVNPPYGPSGPSASHPRPYSNNSSQDYSAYPGSAWPNGTPPSVLQTTPASVPTGPRTSNSRPYGYKEEVDDGVDDDDEAKWRNRAGKDDANAPAQSSQKGTSDFVKKLFSMLDDKAYEAVVAWSPSGESFIVKDMNDFTKHVLPRNFRHSNFASFVRQLNKYDFHKVKNPEDGGSGLGEHVWEFQHPDFIRGREDLLENVRRKIPAKKKSAKGDSSTAGGDPRDDSPSLPLGGEAAERAAESYSELKAQVASLTAVQDQLSSHINGLTKQYQGIIGEMLTFQRNMVQQDQLMQNLIQYLMNLEQGRQDAPTNLLNGGDGAFLPSDEATKLISSYEEVAQASFATMSELSHRIAGKHPNPLPGSGTHATVSGGGGIARSGGAAPGSTRDGQSSISSSSTRRQPGTSISSATPLSPKSSAASPLETVPAKDPAPASAKGKEPARNDDAIILHPPHLDASESDVASLVNAANHAASTGNGVGGQLNMAQLERAGLRVFTVGTLQPREDNEDYLANAAAEASAQSSSGTASKPNLADAVNEAFKRRASTATPNGEFGIRVPQLEELPTSMPRIDGRSDSISGSPPSKSPENGQDRSTPSEGGNYLRVRRSTFVPGWAIPPRVLLVDDDAVCRKLSSKFLQVFGCSIDYAVDGMSAVNKMNLEKYDLVLMDIVMPNLDGVSATSLIRQFDPRTPIISMTSNSGPSELMQYMANGMNDILPKPFTKEGLLNMLEKHLIHLKTVQKMDEIPRSLGLGPVTEEALSAAIPATPSAFADDGTLNPLAGMGFSDEEYVAMLQNLITAGSVSDPNGHVSDMVDARRESLSLKRSAEEDERESKRGRFTEIR